MKIQLTHIENGTHRITTKAFEYDEIPPSIIEAIERAVDLGTIEGEDGPVTPPAIELTVWTKTGRIIGADFLTPTAEEVGFPTLSSRLDDPVGDLEEKLEERNA